MGLDITAYRQLARDDEPERDEHGGLADWRHRVEFAASKLRHTEEHWPGRTAGVSPGVYRWEGEALRFNAGSYTGYGEWRAELAMLAGYPSVNAVWRGEFTEGPFVELINFSDCEGVIGPVAAAKLAGDFVTHEGEVCRWASERFIQLYGLWRRAFEMAADGGAVLFH